MLRSRLAVLLLASMCLLGLALPTSLWAQLTQGNITGLVKDPSGALIAGATVTVTNEGNGNTTTVKAQSNGNYLVPNLEAGLYRVSGEAAGFKRLTISGLKLDVGTALTQDLSLEVGAVTQTITVSGTSNVVNTTENTVGATVAVEPLLNLPLPDRYIYNLANLSAGAFFLAYDDDPVNIRLSNVSLGGGRFNQTLTQIDGIDNTRGDTMGPQTQEIELPPDDVQEFRVLISNLSPEYGRTGGGVMQTVVKGGSNGFHGDLYEVLRGDKTAAAGWNIAAGTRPVIHRNYAGGTVGGPVKKDKAFFFFGYEHLWNNESSSNIDSVGVPAWYGGNFTDLLGPYGYDSGGGVAKPLVLYDPQYAVAGTSNTPFTCQGVANMICNNRIDPTAAKWLTMANYPITPNATPTDPANQAGNFRDVTQPPYTRGFYVGRFDLNLTTKDKLFAHYVDMSDRNIIENGASDPRFGIANGGQNNPSKTQNFAVNWTHIFSPTFFMSATAGAMRLKITTGNFWTNGTNYPAELGLANVPGPIPPGFQFGGGDLNIAEGFGNPTYRVENGVYSNNSVKFTKVVGRNNFSFGGEYDHFNNNTVSFSSAGGNFTFSGGYTAQWINGKQTTHTGANLADFLLGYYSSVTIGPVQTDIGRRAYSLAGYANDDLRLTKNLTLNLGVRYEALTPISSPYNHIYSFSPALPNPLAGTVSGGTAIAAGQTGITTFAGLNGEGEYLWNWEKGALPRVGFAYRLFGRSDWVVRGGFGVFLENPQQNGTYLSGVSAFTSSYANSYNPQGASSPAPSPVLSAGIAAAAVVKPPASALTSTFLDVGTQFANSSVTFWAPKMGIPYTQNLNLSLQHQWQDSLVEVAYIGNLGRDLAGGSINLNLVPPSQLPLLQQANPPNVRTLRPFTQFSLNNASVTLADPNEGVSDYNGLAITFKHNYKNGMMWTVAYTYSKFLDNISMVSNSNVNFGDANGIQNPYNISGEMARDTNDIRHRLVLSPLWELPVGKGKHFLNRGGVLNQVLGGWQVAGDGLWQSGSPFGPTVASGGASFLGDTNYTLRPDKIGPSASPNKWQPATGGVVGVQYLNPASFISPISGCPNNSTAFFPCGTLGDQSRTLPDISGDGIYSLNIQIAKNWYIKEKIRLNFQCNALDVFNTPYLGSSTNGGSWPAESVNGPNFGLFTTEADDASGGVYRRLIDFTLKLYF